MVLYKLKDKVYAFELDGSQDHHIHSDMIRMSNEEVELHYEKNTPKPMDEKQLLRLRTFTNLTKRQFKLGLLEADLIDKLENKIGLIDDHIFKRRLKIEYAESDYFVRTSKAIKDLFDLLGMNELEIDEFWQKAKQL